MLRAKRRTGKPRIPEVSAANRLHGYRLAFLEWLAVQGRSRWTIDWQGNALTYFIRWCDERGLDHLTDVTLPVLERYQRHLYHYRTAQGRPLGWGTQRQRLAVLKVFFRWAVRARHALYNPASEIEIPPRPPRLPNVVLTPEEVEALMAAPDVSTPAGLRDRALLETLYSTGLRRMEASALKLADVHLTAGVIRVREGKGGRDRVVPIGDRAAAWLEKYLCDVRPLLTAGDDPGFVFLTDYGEGFGLHRMAPLVKRHLRRSGYQGHGACHLLRHACATHMLENGADVRFIQALLGHADLNSTQIYTRVSIRKLKEIHTATHPARLKRLGATQARTDMHGASLAKDARAALLAALEAEVLAEAREGGEPA